MSRPLAALVVILAAGVALPPASPFALVALWPIYLLVRSGGWRIATVGVAAVAVAYAAHDAIWADELQLAGLVASVALCGAAVGFGLSAGIRRTATARERELLAKQAATEERLRIARELHDAVGHDVSLMVVQAQALGATSADPAVREGTDAIAALGRRTMGEMHRTLRVLREDAALEPQSSLGALGDVLDGARAAGTRLTYAVEGTPRSLAPALDASAYETGLIQSTRTRTAGE